MPEVDIYSVSKLLNPSYIFELISNIRDMLNTVEII